MRICLLVLLVSLVITCPLFAADKDTGPDANVSQCAGMARTLSVTDEQAFKQFTDLDAKDVENEYGFKSNKHIAFILQQALDKGYGAGLAQGAINAYNYAFAFKLFMKMCYKDDEKFRKFVLTK